MSKTELGVNTAAFYPFNLLGVSLARQLSDRYGFDASALEYMPTKMDGAKVDAPRQHESWRGERKISQVLNPNILKLLLSFSTYVGMPVSDESLETLNNKKPTVIFPEHVNRAEVLGFKYPSVQITNNMPSRHEFYTQKGIAFTLDTQHTPSVMWPRILDQYSGSVVECHIRCGNDIPTWKKHLQALYHGDLEGPLSQVEQLPKETVLISEVTMIAVALSRLGSFGDVYKKVNENIRSAGSNRR